MHYQQVKPLGVRIRNSILNKTLIARLHTVRKRIKQDTGLQSEITLAINALQNRMACLLDEVNVRNIEDASVTDRFKIYAETWEIRNYGRGSDHA